MLRFLQRQFLPVGLVSAALIGLILPAPGIYMARLPTQYAAVSLIFFIAGLLLRTGEIVAALSAWPATLWGAVSILVLTPALGAHIALHLPLEPAFRIGLALFCCMPTTLSSGIALTTQARGNVALALLLTVLTNIGGIFTVPFALVLLLDPLLQSIGPVELSAGDLLVKLCLSILLPLSAGKYLRRFAAGWVDGRRARLSLLSNLALVSVPWMQFSQSSERLAQVAPPQLLLLVGAGLAIHALYLLLNAGAVKLLPIGRAEGRAVVLLASQKTLPVAMTVLAFLPVPDESKGLVAIPSITFHLGQIFADAFLATHWSRQPP